MCIWIEDADAIEMKSTAYETVYKNERVHEFLYNKNMLGIAGIKGQGKTFLIKVKRKLSQSDDNSIVCFPKDRMVDTSDNSLRINQSLYKLLNDFNQWVYIWKIAIALTIIKSEDFSELYTKKDIHMLSDITKVMLDIDNPRCSPVKIFKRILQLNRRDVNLLIMDITNILDLLERVHSAIHLFIDKVDQAFSTDLHRIYGDSPMSRGPRNASYWQYSQYALASASYDIFSNINNHIKVYYTIRQEALIDSHELAPNTKRNIEAYLVTLYYSKIDLYNMFKLYIENEKDTNLIDYELKWTNPVKAFLGIDKIPHTLHNGIKDEKIFDYIYRYSLKRPYDIIKICRELYLIDSFDKVDLAKKIRTSVNNTSISILKTYISELLPFIPCTYENILDLAKCINTNVFTNDYMKIVCDRYCAFYNSYTICNHDCENCINPKAFAILYNLGLLGINKNNNAENHNYIRFIYIGDSVFNFHNGMLPKADLYFLHPSLSDIFSEERNKKSTSFIKNNEIIVGDRYDCYINNISYDSINSRINELQSENIFVSSTIYDLKEERQAIRSYLFQRGFYPIMSETNEFDINKAQMYHSHDYCLDQVMKCHNLVFIIGKSYGGIYSGFKYKKQAEAIKEMSKNKVIPSISLMELFLAREKKLNCYVFVSEEIDNIKRLKIDLENDNSIIDKRVLDEINFITHFYEEDSSIKGNWISVYSDLDDLLYRIDHLSFTISKRNTQ